MKYAIIGCGRIAPCHIQAAAANNMDIACLCDVDPGAMEALAASFPVCAGARRYTDYARMIGDEPDLELVSVATPSGSHAEIALYCIRRGINVIIEKPVAMSIEDADAIVSAADKHGVKACACHQNRFNVPVQMLKKALDEGRLGRLSHGSVCVRWFRDKSYYDQAGWRGTWQDDGGCLMNQCIHGIDLLRWLMGGEIESVFGFTARQQHPYIEAEDMGVALVKFKNGAAATIEGSVNVYKTDLEEELCIFGDKGSAKIGGICANRLERLQYEGMEQGDTEESFCEKTHNIYGNGHTGVFADMARAIAEDRQPYIDVRAGRDALELVLAVYQSCRDGKPVTLPLRRCSSRDFAGLFEK
ncbi:MAG: Gfo/Idh/MocA family oxidoreductase [Abditibacteriota bacterium]|nr:Gfo/Idh/MocA family oxidoreductase [Abditibacteriota bacterium]